MNNRKDIKIIQVSSEPDKNREIRSYDSLSQLGYRYIRIVNPRYMKYPPVDNVFDNHKEWVIGITKPDPNQWGLTSGHYGAWQGHMSAIFASFVDKDYTLICECDCLITVDPQFFRDRVDEAINLLENSDYKVDKSMRSLRTDFNYKMSSYEEMILEMKNWIEINNYNY